MLHINKTIENGKAAVSLEGRLDTTTAPDLERELKETLRNYHDLPFSKKQKAKIKLFSFSPKLYVLSMKLRGK